MKKVFITLISFSLLAMTSFAQGEMKDDDVKAIKEVIRTAYVDGLQNRGDLDLTKKGFHEGFELLGVRDNNLTKFPIYSWVNYVEAAKEKSPEPPAGDELVTVKFLDVDVTGDAAMAKIELHKGGRHIFIDYLSLYRFEEGWRIVSKIYYRIPE